MNIDGWNVFSFFFGAFCCIVLLGWRSYQDPDRDDDDGECWDDLVTEEYDNAG